MNVVIENDGPVTISLDTPTLPPPKEVFCVYILNIFLFRTIMLA